MASVVRGITFVLGIVAGIIVGHALCSWMTSDVLTARVVAELLFATAVFIVVYVLTLIDTHKDVF